MRKNNFIHSFILLGCCCLAFAYADAQSTTITIPLGGNGWSNSEKGGAIDSAGIVDWSDRDTRFDAWFRVTDTGMVHIWLTAAAQGGKSRIRVTEGAGVRELDVEGDKMRRYDAGSFIIRDTGYQSIRIEALSRSGPYFANIRDIVVQGSPINGHTAYVPDNQGNFFHWGRRGPSVHLNYIVPKDMHVEWFYNEVTVPEGQDVVGSYFMANGFGQGYFGMQVNSLTERRILFSVWSPYTTDDPRAIPDSLRIILQKKGEGVHAGVFGDEGSGGQSYLTYSWKAGHTYRFLLHARPTDHNYTSFTAWFYAPEEGRWRLIASFSRPQTQGWLTGLYSFLENFEPQQGMYERSALYGHQWVRDDVGNWIPLSKARFTADNTARKGYRLDYAGGVIGQAFYLRNGGFFSDYTPIGSLFERPPDNAADRPVIDLSTLIYLH